MPKEFWNVYNHVARQWYETEYGAVESADRWYHPAMIMLEWFAMQHNPATAIHARRAAAVSSK